MMRFEESVKFIRQRIAAGAIGRPQVARADFFAPMLTSARTWVGDPKLAAGGPLSDIGVHCIDTLRFVLGDEVLAVSARAHYDSHRVMEASAVTVLEFARRNACDRFSFCAQSVSDVPGSRGRDVECCRH